MLKKIIRFPFVVVGVFAGLVAALVIVPMLWISIEEYTMKDAWDGFSSDIGFPWVKR